MNNYHELIKSFPKIEKNVLLGHFTTFKIGGLADLFYEIEEEEELIRLVKKIKELEIPYFILGGGSNLLIGDNGFRGIVIKISSNNFIQDGEEIEVGAGVNLSWLVNEAKELALSGLECCSGIPGTVGGAIVGNAGSKDDWIDSVILKVKIIDLEGNIKELDKEECQFSYRYSRFKESKEIIVSAVLQLIKSTPVEVENKMNEFLEKKMKQPKGYSAGSVFKNPAGNSAGKLIDDAGLRGFKIGQAQISESHANFIINLGGAKAADVLKLIELIKEKVKEKFGIDLELEIKILNE